MRVRVAIMERDGRATWLAAGVAVLLMWSLMGGRASAAASDLAVARALSNAVADVAEKAAPAVVHVQALRTLDPQAMRQQGFRFRGTPDAELFRRFFGDPGPFQEAPGRMPEQKIPSQGSGFLIDAAGIVVTNNHVVEKAERVTVVLHDDRKFEAEILGTDPRTDIAVLKLKEVKDSLPFLPLGDSGKLRVGEMVIAIGSPFGLDHTVTSGIVSAKGRQTRILGENAYEDFIQTDAAINPGNSGGPLLNLDGEVIGINSAIMSGSGTNAGVGFAIPMTLADYVIRQLSTDGKVTRGWLGIGIQDMDQDKAAHFPGYPGKGGVIVTQVGPGMPAEKAGIKASDVVLEFDGVTVSDTNQFRTMVAMKPVGKSFPVVVLRNGKRLTLNVTIAQQAENPTLGEDLGAAGTPGTAPAKTFGFSVQELTEEIASKLGMKGSQGVLVSEVDAEADAHEKGLRPGMVILAVNQEDVDGIESFSKAMASAKDDSVLLRVRTRAGVIFLAIKRSK